jgi:hypothetical protein
LHFLFRWFPFSQQGSADVHERGNLGGEDAIVNLTERQAGAAEGHEQALKSADESFTPKLLEKLELGLMAAVGLAAGSDRQAAITGHLPSVSHS